MLDETAHRETCEPVIPIGVLAQMVGLSTSAVRKYENEGFIIAFRTAGGHRLFSFEDIQRVQYLQHMIQDLGLNTEGIRRMQALLPCWLLLPCAAEIRQTCPARQDKSRPCWMIKGLDCAPQGNECRRCVVYRFGTLCTHDIKCLLYHQDDRRNAVAAARELLRRRQDSGPEE